MDYQRIIRSSIFFSPYLKYSFQMNVSDLLWPTSSVVIFRVPHNDAVVYSIFWIKINRLFQIQTTLGKDVIVG